MLHSINIFVHILAGMIAIIFGIRAYAAPLGSEKHRKAGRYFLGFMAIVLLTAISGVLFFIEQPFLTVVTFQSFYTSYSGYRVLKTKERGFQTIDFLVMLFVAAVGLSFLLRMHALEYFWNKNIVYYLLIYLFMIVGFDIIRFLQPNLIKVKGFWLYEHIYKMTSAFTALVSAGFGSVFLSWEPYNQIVPAILGSWWLIFCLIYFPRFVFRARRSKASQVQYLFSKICISS